MWKYKEVFAYPELGNLEQDGELDFIKSIVEENSNI